MRGSKHYLAPLRDFEFLIHEVLPLARLAGVERLGKLDCETSGQVLAAAAHFLENEVAPLDASWDAKGCSFSGGEVVTPHGFEKAYAAFIEGGWPALTGTEAHGGQAMPSLIGICFTEMLTSASMAFSIIPSLNRASQSLFDEACTEDQRRVWLPQILSGEAAVSMQLTEAHCGTDIGLLKTRAVPSDQGSYRLTGSKVWISGGEHQLTQNIFHLVLARIEGSPEGLKGLSLFMVPKYRLMPDGSPGPRNHVFCTGIEEKMGNHGSPTCFMHHEGSVGYLVGRVNRGLTAMFSMMNSVRLDVAVQGLGVAEAAYQNALIWSKSRLQGRSLKGIGAGAANGPEPILVHPDVRRTLFEIRCILEAGRFLALRTALLVDLAALLPDPTISGECLARVSLLTPMMKSYFSEFGFKAASSALQLFGGAGYTRSVGMEQLVRDSRLGMIYEGANGIQALDLVKRKVVADQGHAIGSFTGAVQTNILSADPRLGPMRDALSRAVLTLRNSTELLIHRDTLDPEAAAASSAAYLELLAHVAMADSWLTMANVALGKLDAGTNESDFYNDKLRYADFYYEQILPNIGSLREKVKACSAVSNWPSTFQR